MEAQWRLATGEISSKIMHGSVRCNCLRIRPSPSFAVMRSSKSQDTLMCQGSCRIMHAVPSSVKEHVRHQFAHLSVQPKPQSRSLAVFATSSTGAYIYPELTTKPKWWWRTLAAVPYLLPLHNVWSYASVIYHLQPILEGFEFMANPFLDTMALLPSWLVLMLFMGIYFFVVRRREWPHFLRFHVATAMLLDTGFQAAATACTWLPPTLYRGRGMAYLWITVAFVQVYTILECMRCALAGMCTEVPFLSDAAYIHTDLNLLKY